MDEPIADIAASFDQRASRYASSEWHLEYARKFVRALPLRPGDRVLDVGTGTGFAALLAAQRTGSGSLVVGVDVSIGMLREALSAIATSGLVNIRMAAGDALNLPFHGPAFDVVMCSSALLYMPAARALRDWRRVIRPGGTVAFSTMAEGAPPAGRLFRDCAREFGLTLEDPSAELGTPDRCAAALSAAGFGGVRVLEDDVHLSRRDLENAWDSNSRSAKHGPVRRLDERDRERLRRRYEGALRSALECDADAFTRTRVLFALATQEEGTA